MTPLPIYGEAIGLDIWFVHQFVLAWSTMSRSVLMLYFKMGLVFMALVPAVTRVRTWVGSCKRTSITLMLSYIG